MAWVETDLKDHLVPTPSTRLVVQNPTPSELEKSIKSPNLKYFFFLQIYWGAYFVLRATMFFIFYYCYYQQKVHLFSVLASVLYYLQKHKLGFPDNGKNKTVCTLGSTMRIHSNVPVRSQLEPNDFTGVD